MRWTVRVAASAVILLVSAAPAWAGGWAVTSFENAPDEFVAGETYALRYTILQHGVNPIDIEETSVVLRSTSGTATETFVAAPTGDPGRYVAEVTIPAEGTWTWEVTQGWFAPQPLGLMEIAGPPGWFPWSTRQVLQVILALATLAAAALLVLQAGDLRRHRLPSTGSAPTAG